MDVPSWRDTRTLDEYFIMGRNMWPDLKEIKNLEYRRDLVPDDVVRFIRSTALNEHGIVHYVKGYFRAYADDYKLAIWASMWGGEEYLHSIVLRTILEGLGETISPEEYEGLETGDYAASYDSYLEERRKGYKMDTRLQQLIYGVVQEYAAKIAYSSVADVAGCPTVESLLRRVAKDETRHCRFFQLCLEALAENLDDEGRAEIFPQFSDLFKDLQMPQEHIPMFSEFDMGTDLYIKFWTPEYRSNLVLYLTNYFRKFRAPMGSGAAGEAPAAAAAGALPA
jgi:rubrerythrin